MDDNEESLANYYSLMELLDKLGKDGVAELVSKGKPHKISRGEMIYFLKEDVHRILGEELIDDQSVSLIVDSIVDVSDILHRFIFKETLIRRQQLEQEEELYQDRVLDLSQDVCYGRTKGNPETCSYLKGHSVISSLHGKLYLDGEGNLLYQNFGVNKTKVRGCRDQTYSTLDQNEASILVSREVFDETILKQKPLLISSLKLGYQIRPYFIIRIRITKKSPSV